MAVTNLLSKHYSASRVSIPSHQKFTALWFWSLPPSPPLSPTWQRMMAGEKYSPDFFINTWWQQQPLFKRPFYSSHEINRISIFHNFFSILVFTFLSHRSESGKAQFPLPGRFPNQNEVSTLARNQFMWGSSLLLLLLRNLVITLASTWSKI